MPLFPPAVLAWSTVCPLGRGVMSRCHISKAWYHSGATTATTQNSWGQFACVAGLPLKYFIVNQQVTLVFCSHYFSLLGERLAWRSWTTSNRHGHTASCLPAPAMAKGLQVHQGFIRWFHLFSRGVFVSFLLEALC